MKTIGDLRKLLEENQWSCETLSEKVPVSNMTWRRLLKKKDSVPLPEKYRTLLMSLREEGGGSAPNEIALVLSGMQQTQDEVVASLGADGAAVADSEVLFCQAETRAKLKSVPAKLKQLIKDAAAGFSKLGHGGKLLVLGGVAYFVNPFDLIADPIISLGFLDDVGILTLIHQKLRGSKEKTP